MRVKRVFGGYEWLKLLPDGRFRITTTTNFGGYVVVMVVMQFLNNSTPYLGGNKSH